jgi:hypothetical protein
MGNRAAGLADLRHPKSGLDSCAYWQEDYVVGVSTLGETLTLDKTILIYLY